MSDDPWISSHLELRGEDGEMLSGYGWVFPLGNGAVNLGAGTLATARRPAEVAIKPLMQPYAETIGDEFGLSGELRDADLGAVADGRRGVTTSPGANWALVGDAAACVNPLNGEGIDYGLETGRLVAETLASRTRPRPRGPACCASTTARRSRSPAGSPGWPPCRGSCARSARPACARTG